MGKFAKSIRDKAKKTEVLVDAPVFIPLDSLDLWRGDIVSGKLPVNAQMQLYYNVGIHSFVVNALLEKMNLAGATQEQLLDLMRELYQEGVMAVTESVHKQAVSATYKN